MLLWFVRIICLKLIEGIRDDTWGLFFSVCSCSAYFSCLSKCHIVCMFFSPMNTKPSAVATGQTIRVGSLEHISENDKCSKAEQLPLSYGCPCSYLWPQIRGNACQSHWLSLQTKLIMCEQPRNTMLQIFYFILYYFIFTLLSGPFF